MADFFNTLMSSSDWTLVKYAVLGYFSLLWLFIIIWVTRDALSRSESIIFQMIAILINIALPFLGVLLYLIIRPGKTQMERYYQDMEAELLKNEEKETQVHMCQKCMMPTEINHEYCPNCGEELKKKCGGCKKKFAKVWQFCPFCGIEYSEENPEDEKPPKTSSRRRKKKEDTETKS